MNDADTPERRLRFYGMNDFATFWQAERVAAVVANFDASQRPEDVNDVLELHNVGLFIDAGLTPTSVSAKSLAEVRRTIRRLVASWFNEVNDANVAERLNGVVYAYRGHLLDLMAGLGLFSRSSADAMLPALTGAKVHLRDMLSSKRLVEAYGSELQALLMGHPQGAEIVIEHHLRADARRETILPAGLTKADVRALLTAYIASENPNPNYLQLVVNAPNDNKAGIDNRLMVAAQRRYESEVKAFFEDTPGIKMGCAATISPDQAEPVTMTADDLTMEFTYGESWLDETTDYASILTNFQFLFEFADWDGLLTLPAFAGERRGIVDMFGVPGVKHYPTNQIFDMKDRASFVQTAMYQRYLQSKDIDLEEVLRWFYEVHLPAEYAIEGFVFHPSSPSANHLARCRNLFPEMESIATQFSLYVEDGEIDHDLATASADSLRYRDIPSALDGKYAYPTDHPDLPRLLRLLFSDQSELTYINETLHADTAVELFLEHAVSFDALEDWQKSLVDELGSLGVLADVDGRIMVDDLPLVFVLKNLWTAGAVAYHHLEDTGRIHVDRMVANGQLGRRSSLLTESEASYFNYYLNTQEFSNGPKIRNKYQHGNQRKGVGEAEFEATYFMALRLMVALTIKINDELTLRFPIHG